MANIFAQMKERSKPFVHDPLEEEMSQVLFECVRELSKTTVEELFGQFLPRLAQHFDGKALDNLKTANPWLAVFDPSSTSNWEEAKSAFLMNGPACLDVLASFTSLIRSEALIGSMLERNVTRTTLLLLAIRKKIEHIENQYDNPKKVAVQMGVWSDKMVNEISQAGEQEAAIKGRVEFLLNNSFTAEEVNKSQKVQYHPEVGEFAIHWIFQRYWKELGHQGQEKVKDEFLFYKDTFRLYVDKIVAGLEDTNGTPVAVNYKRKIQTFVYQVGCAKVHDEPEENIAELRLFHSTTIGYFANLQAQFVKKEREAKELKHHISALQFRYLLEHLTPPQQPGTIYTDAQPGPRWIKFWEEALKNEDGHNLRGTAYAQDHPLKSIVDARNPTRGYVDPGTRARTIHKGGKNGQLYRTGDNLYGTLSDEIHHFPPGEFVIQDDDGWTKLVTDTLRALQPLRKNGKLVNVDADGDLQWDKERDRYLHP